MRILALDLGTKTGWAFYDNGVLTSGTWTLATAKQIKTQKQVTPGWDCRASQLKEHIQSFFPEPDFIYYEDVQFASTTLQAHLWGGFRAIVSLFYPPSQMRAVPVGTLKKFATGNGAATKEMMAQALVKEAFVSGGIELSKKVLSMDDNEVDAYHLLRFAMKELQCQ